ncbi:MAG: dTDP-4-dehydrorhamnose 3,5-epimerase family protein, partial [Cetobacterium sp.]
MKKFNRVETGIKDLIVIEPTVFGDNRGFFLESYSRKDFEEIGMDIEFVQ